MRSNKEQNPLIKEAMPLIDELKRNSPVNIDKSSHKHVVFYSGGIGSFGAAYKLIKNGVSRDDIILLFTDTLMEDLDLYRFLKETTDYLKVPLTYIADGRDPWQIFFDVRFLGNNFVDPCSKILKRDLARKWVKSNFKPNEVTLYLGIDWTESHRWHRSQKYWLPYDVQAPLCVEPYIEKEELFNILKENDVKKPRLYEMGYSHNNCGGFCIKQGQGTYKKLLEIMPERYRYHEQQEKEIREYLEKDVTILKRIKNGVQHRYTLTQFREDIEAAKAIDEEDIGGCGCMLEDNEETNEVCKDV